MSHCLPKNNGYLGKQKKNVGFINTHYKKKKNFKNVQ